MAMAIPAMEMILPQTAGGNIPAFLAKLWKMVNNPEIGNIRKLKWSLPEIMPIYSRSFDWLV